MRNTFVQESSKMTKHDLHSFWDYYHCLMVDKPTSNALNIRHDCFVFVFVFSNTIVPNTRHSNNSAFDADFL